MSLVTVIVPAFNEERNIARALEAINAQTSPADEVIVVDNNSTDRTADIARAHGARVVNESKQGIAAARNRGFAEAVGDIIARTDADCFVDRNWLAAIRRELTPESRVVLAGKARYAKLGVPFAYPGHLTLMRLTTGTPTLFGFNMATSKSFWDEIKDKLHDTTLEDFDTALHTRLVGGEIRYVTDMLVYSPLSNVTRGLKRWLITYPKEVIRLNKTHKVSR